MCAVLVNDVTRADNTNFINLGDSKKGPHDSECHVDALYNVGCLYSWKFLWKKVPRLFTIVEVLKII